ncbi:NAD(P)H-dependent glycerol-3-phosphate dehydrogenase [Henriciella sp.]|uniref:NAD(P)H-dependent glycerol-3-phosphate dehydrogenase n=1 Tax=Henriciella sp. TaxID=1968823 RepID=UPI00262BF448|nr:NAD(P)H-dependent glycerol-3-phosphate dehydrogenase [Henriciella sp.]
MQTIGVLGAGAWGSALAYTAHAAGRDTRIWALEPEVAAALSAGKGNPAYLPTVDLPAMPASSQLESLAGCEALLAVVPAQHARRVFAALAPHVADGVPVLLCSKGIERDTHSLMTDVLRETIPHATPAVLSGPSFAADVARGLPTAVTLACEDKALGEALMTAIGRPAFRPYWSSDLIGAEVGGAVKNVLAIACGVVEGLELGRSAHAALIARGFAEMSRLAVAMGAQPGTLSGLCGLGDLVLTCSSVQSRNMSFGKALGEGRSARDVLAERNSVTEGVATAPAIATLAETHGIEMPICEAVDDILSERASLDTAMNNLLSRPFTQEGL